MIGRSPDRLGWRTTVERPQRSRGKPKTTCLFLFIYPNLWTRMYIELKLNFKDLKPFRYPSKPQKSQNRLDSNFFPTSMKSKKMNWQLSTTPGESSSKGRRWTWTVKIRIALYRPCPSGQTDNGQKIRTVNSDRKIGQNPNSRQTSNRIFRTKKEKRTEHGQRCRPMSDVWWSCRYLKIFDFVGKKVWTKPKNAAQK